MHSFGVKNQHCAIVVFWFWMYLRISTFTHNSIKYMEKRHTYPRERDKSATLQLIPRATTTSTASSSPPSIATMDRSISHSWQFCGSSQRHLLSWALSTVTMKTAITWKWPLLQNKATGTNCLHVKRIVAYPSSGIVLHKLPYKCLSSVGIPLPPPAASFLHYSSGGFG